MKLGPKNFTLLNTSRFEVYRLYETIIATYDKETGVIVMDNGGWQTNHTKKCLNLMLAPYGIKVVQKKNQWYVSFGDNEVEFFNNICVSTRDRKVV